MIPALACSTPPLFTVPLVPKIKFPSTPFQLPRYAQTTRLINSYILAISSSAAKSKRWLVPSRTSNSTSDAVVLSAATTSTACWNGTLSSVLWRCFKSQFKEKVLGREQTEEVRGRETEGERGRTHVPWMMNVGGAVNSPEARPGAMLKDLGSIPVPSRRREERMPLRRC